jgi:hypothetical protein
MRPGSQVSDWYQTKIKTYLPAESREKTSQLLLITLSSTVLNYRGFQYSFQAIVQIKFMTATHTMT